MGKKRGSLISCVLLLQVASATRKCQETLHTVCGTHTGVDCKFCALASRSRFANEGCNVAGLTKYCFIDNFGLPKVPEMKVQHKMTTKQCNYHCCYAKLLGLPNFRPHNARDPKLHQCKAKLSQFPRSEPCRHLDLLAWRKSVGIEVQTKADVAATAEARVMCPCSKKCGGYTKETFTKTPTPFPTLAPTHPPTGEPAAPPIVFSALHTERPLMHDEVGQGLLVESEKPAKGCKGKSFVKPGDLIRVQMNAWTATCKPQNALKHAGSKYHTLPDGSYFACTKIQAMYGLMSHQEETYQGKFVGGIKGFNDGILGMCKNEWRKIGIPPNLGFGRTFQDYGADIHASDWLYIEVRLLDNPESNNDE